MKSKTGNKEDRSRLPTAPIVPPEQIPQNTIKAYKLMRIMSSRPGQLLPLFAKEDLGEGSTIRKGYELGQWHRAETQFVQIGGKPLADRPGLHGMMLPIFDQGEVRRKGHKRVWVEVEMPAFDAETQREAGKRGLRGNPPDVNKSYNFATNPKATEAGGWPIAGSMKVVRVLNDSEVESILSDAGKDSFIDQSMTGFENLEIDLLNTFAPDGFKAIAAAEENLNA